MAAAPVHGAQESQFAAPGAGCEQFELRSVSRQDVPALLAVYQACEDFLALGPQSTASEAMIDSDMTQCAAACGLFRGISWHGALVGVVDHRGHGHEGDPGLGYMALLMIVPEARGVGLGAAVVRRVEAEIAGDERVCAIGCSVQVNNPAALRFWQRLGYAVVSAPEAQPDGTTVVHLRKQLRA